MHSSDSPSPVLQEEEQTLWNTQGLVNTHLDFPFTKVFFWDSTVPLDTFELHLKQETAVYHPLS